MTKAVEEGDLVFYYRRLIENELEEDGRGFKEKDSKLA
jgi:hypothetical protein